MAKKTSKKTRFVALIGLVLVIVVGITVATVPEIRDPIMNMFKVSEPIMLTAFQIETLDNDCFSNEFLKLAGCKYDLVNDFRDLSLSMDIITFETFDSIFDETPELAQRTIWILTGDCISSNFRAEAIDSRFRIDSLIGGMGEVEECVNRVVFDTFHWDLKVVDGERTFVRINTENGCTIKIPPPPTDSGESLCVDSDGDGILDGYDELQSECLGILGIDCPLVFTCEFEDTLQGRDPHLRNCTFT